jgi:hypothetical protein
MNKKVIINLDQSERVARDSGGKQKTDENGYGSMEICYRIHSTKNTVDYTIGQVLSKYDVHQLITNTTNEINIRPNVK